MSINPSPKTTQTIQHLPITDTPLRVDFNPLSDWVAIVLHGTQPEKSIEFSADYIGPLVVGLLGAERAIFDTTTTRKRED